MPNNVRISLKTDLLSNWNNSNIILNDGEFALIQMPNNTVKIKIGNGTDLISALPYLNETEFFTNSLSAIKLNIGQFNSTTTYSLVTGLHVSADAINSTVFGYNAKSETTDQRAFVWNGKNLYGTTNTYKSHGQGTFSLNPENGLSGIYIGEETLATLLNNKIAIDGRYIDTLSVCNISRDDYHNLVNSETGPDKNTLYIVSSDTLNLYGEQIKNLAPGTDLSDAVNVEQLCSAISSIDIPEIPVKVSEFENDANYANISVDGAITTDFKVEHIAQDKYHELVNSETGPDKNTLYIVSSDTLNMYGEAIQNLADPINETDATNKQYVDSISSFLSNDYIQKIDQNNIIYDNKINVISNIIDNKITIDSISTQSIDIKHITQDDYHELVATDSILSNTLYIVSSDNLNAYREQIKNISAGTDPLDATNVEQVTLSIDNVVANINSTKNEIVDQLNKKIYIDSISAESISVQHITQDDYHELVATDSILSNTLYIVSSDNLNAYNERIENVAEPLSANDATNKAYVDKSTIQDICLIKPVSDNKLFIKLYFSENADLTDTFELDSKLQPEFFKGLVSSSDLMSWLQQPEDGFNKSFNSLPITIELVRYLASINKSHIYKFYVKYEWYFEDENRNKHISDQYSIIIPSYTEVGANSSETINKFDFENIKQQVNPEDYNAILDENNYYVAYSTKYNTITDLVEDNSYIALADYNTHKRYKIDFRTNTDQNVKLNFYVDLGSGSFEYSDKLNSEQYTFEKDKHYLIEIIDERIYVQNADKVYSEVSDSVSKYPLILAEMIETNGQLTYKIIDHSITTIEITDENKPVTLTLPDKDKNKYARDFILRVEIKSSTAPMFTFVGLDDSWFVESDNEEWMIMEPGVNIISFTETKA